MNVGYDITNLTILQTVLYDSRVKKFKAKHIQLTINSILKSSL